MRKITSTIALVVLTATVSDAQTIFGPETGLNISNIKEKSSNLAVNGMAKAGFKLGLSVDDSLGSNIYLQSGLYYSSKGAEFPGGTTIKINYMEVPLNLLYKFRSRTGNFLLVGAGLYGAFALGGTVKEPSTYFYNGSRELSVGSDASDDIKTFDLGLNLQAGYQFKTGLFFRAQYQFGLANINPDQSNSSATNDKITVRNNNIGITVGWLFGSYHQIAKRKKAPSKK